MGYMGADAAPMPEINGDTGGASRFYPMFRYQAKAPASERPRLEDGTAHETVKSLGLMTWMVKLITRPGGTVLDMFAGSGPVAEACIVEGFRCVLIEQDPKSAELIRKRLSKPIQPVLDFGESA
jgi:site-specific DNA-methyltransferase (adenine-specific)